MNTQLAPSVEFAGELFQVIYARNASHAYDFGGDLPRREEPMQVVRIARQEPVFVID